MRLLPAWALPSLAFASPARLFNADYRLGKVGGADPVFASFRIRFLSSEGAVRELSDGNDHLVGDIKFGGREIGFAAQVTDFINRKLTGVGTRFNQSTVEPMTGCRR